MPKIVIREFDKTTAGSANYSNFSVVIPGLKTEGIDKTVFDENGVYECSSKTEFKDKIGLEPASKTVLAKAIPFTGDVKTLTEAEFNEKVAEGKLYIRTVKEDNKDTSVGMLKDADHYYSLALKERKDKYIFKPTNPEEIKKNVEYTEFIEAKNIGSDELTAAHYGNQIAYELLELGYTVLYKAFNPEEIDDDGKLVPEYQLNNEKFWAPLKDKSLYDFRYIVSGLINENDTVNHLMVDVAEFRSNTTDFDKINVLEDGRGDCIALLDIDEGEYLNKSQVAAIEKIKEAVAVLNSKSAAYFAPTVCYKFSDSKVKPFEKNNKFPASFHYLACAARAAENYNEWYAIAGYTRGISNYVIESVGCKFGEAAINVLQPRSTKSTEGGITSSVNVITKIKGNYYLWGNRTAYSLKTEDDLIASHFLNIRQLCISIKKQVYVACRQFTFDPNSNALWNNFCNAIRPTLEKMKADQGITDYKIMKVKHSKKALLAAKIRIVPIEAVEDFDISLYLEDAITGDIVIAE